VRRVRSQPHLPSHPYEVRFPNRFPLVDADPDRMTQLLVNLLENAAKYAPPRTPILVEGHVEGDALAVSVVDQGPGLSPDQAAHVFDKFYRVDSGPTRATEGTGLGLAICRGVVEAHGGHISITSRPGQGCTFTFRLPAMREEAATASDEASRAVHLPPGTASLPKGEFS
jgi:two-component system OmpR family sensor kinase